MNQNVCPKCSAPLNEAGICLNCGYQAANEAAPDMNAAPENLTQMADPPQSAPQQTPPRDPAQPFQPAPDPANNSAAPYQPPTYQPNTSQYSQQPVNPNPGYGYPQQGYPQQGYPQQDPNNYPPQGYSQYPQTAPTQQNQPVYPQPQYPQQPQQYPQQPQQYPQQPVPPQQQYPQQPVDAPQKSNKTFSRKKVLGIGIPVIAVILIAVIMFTVVVPAIKKSKKDDGTFSIGDTWEVKDQWSFKIRGVYEVTDRYTEHNANSDISDPAAVYVIDYEFKNLGYYYTEEKDDKNEKTTDNSGINNSSDPHALSMFLQDKDFVDSEGESAFQYTLFDFYGDYSNAAEDETTHTWEVIGVNHKGDLSYSFEKATDSKHGSKTHVATFKLTPDPEPTETALLRYEIDENAQKLTIGETWTVDDQWTLTINSVKKTSDRSKYSKVDYDVADVYVIDYTYTNINYNDSNLDGLYFFFSNYTKDTAGVTCGHYTLIGVDDDYTTPDFIKPGKTKHCQDCIAVSKSGGFTVDAPQSSDDDHGNVRYHYGFQYKD